MPTNVMPKGWRFIAELPPRRDCESVVEKTWEVPLPDGLVIEGQRFSFPEGLNVEAEVQWLEEESLLSVRLSLTASLTGECARCLTKASLAISDDLMYLYQLRGLELGKDTKLESDEGFLPVEVDYWGRTLDLADQVWESFLMLLPAKLLCREDCLGLCSYCGADLNEGPCSCSSQEIDPRFEILRETFANENMKV